MNVYFIVMNVVDNIQIKGNDVAQTYIGDSKLISDYLIYHIQIYSVRLMIIHDLNMILGIDFHILCLTVAYGQQVEFQDAIVENVAYTDTRLNVI